MGNNQFIVDLGDIKLTDAQKKSINASIQKAVAGELATIDTGHQLVLIPRRHDRNKFLGPIIWGIIIRPIDQGFAQHLNIPQGPKIK